MIPTHPVKDGRLKYSYLVGTGGIGSGIFFKMEGNHTLGRNESRLAYLTSNRDYCKLHIIVNYIAVLLNVAESSDFKVFAIGKVGDDEPGRQMIYEMQKVGINTDGVEMAQDCSTLFSVCFQYPDGEGGNITTSNGASGNVNPSDIECFFINANYNVEESGIAMAVPEVPMEARIRLLKEGRRLNCFNVAAVLSSEVREFESANGFEYTDFLALNMDEARAIANMREESSSPDIVVEKCINALLRHNKGIFAAITNGSHGSYGYRNGTLERVPVLITDAVGTAGAGDAFLAGVLVGLNCGLPYLKGRNDSYFSETPLASALELGTLLSSLTVTSPHSICEYADTENLLKYAIEKKLRFSSDFSKLFFLCK